MSEQFDEKLGSLKRRFFERAIASSNTLDALAKELESSSNYDSREISAMIEARNLVQSLLHNVQHANRHDARAAGPRRALPSLTAVIRSSHALLTASAGVHTHVLERDGDTLCASSIVNASLSFDPCAGGDATV